MLRKLCEVALNEGRVLFDVIAVDRRKSARRAPDVEIASGLKLSDAEDLAVAVTMAGSKHWRDGSVMWVDASDLRDDYKDVAKKFLDGVEIQDRLRATPSS